MSEKSNVSDVNNEYSEDDILTNNKKILSRLIKDINITKYLSYLSIILAVFIIISVLSVHKLAIKKINKESNLIKNRKFNQINIPIQEPGNNSRENELNNYNQSKIFVIKDKQPNNLKNFEFERKTKKMNITHYIEIQNDFCRNFEKYTNAEFEKSIIRTHVNFAGKTYPMYVYKENDYVSSSIRNYKNWESSETFELIKALNFYKKKINISNNEEILCIDVGANIGWYTTILAKLGYSVISFEPGKRNSYLLKKNCCLNNFTNTIIINKGLYGEEKISELRHVSINLGNAIIIDDVNAKLNTTNYHPELVDTIELVKLSDFIPYLTLHNLAIIKMDVEGSEGQVLKGGIEIIEKYHVPFILTEFCPKALQNHNTSLLEFLNLFYDNKYKISTKSFFSTNYKNLEYFLNLSLNSNIQIFAVYDNFLK